MVGLARRPYEYRPKVRPTINCVYYTWLHLTIEKSQREHNRDVNKAGSFKAKAKARSLKAKTKAKARDQG